MSVEHETSRLYGLPLEEFTSERDRLARSLRKEGEREQAATIAGLRKPTLAAWAVNQLARRERRDVDLLLDSGRRLLDAQRASLERGGRAELDRTRASLDQAVAGLVASARDLLGERPTEATLDRIAETLRSAAVSAEGRELLATGSVTKELSETGWDLLTTLGADLPAPPKRPPASRERRDRERKAGAPSGAEEDAGETAAPGAEPRAGKRRAREAERGADRRRRQELRDALREARQRRTELARALREAEREEKGVAKELERARKRRERAQQELAEAEEAVEEAERASRELGTI